MVPVSLVGVKRVVPRGIRTLRPGTVALRIHPPVPTLGPAHGQAEALAEQVAPDRGARVRGRLTCARLVALACWRSLAPLGAAAPGAARHRRRRWPAAIDRIVDQPAFAPAFWGIEVRDLRTGRVLYARNASKNMTPASTMKLVTTAAALDALGPEARIRTTAREPRRRLDGTGRLAGDLYLVGRGDPGLARAWPRRPHRLRRLRGRPLGGRRSPRRRTRRRPRGAVQGRAPRGLVGMGRPRLVLRGRGVGALLERQAAPTLDGLARRRVRRRRRRHARPGLVVLRGGLDGDHLRGGAEERSHAGARSRVEPHPPLGDLPGRRRAPTSWRSPSRIRPATPPRSSPSAWPQRGIRVGGGVATSSEPLPAGDAGPGRPRQPAARRDPQGHQQAQQQPAGREPAAAPRPPGERAREALRPASRRCATS